MTVKKKGFGFVSSYFSREDSLKSVRKVDLELKEINTGKSFTLNNILFDVNSTELKYLSFDLTTTRNNDIHHSGVAHSSSSMLFHSAV